MYVLVLCFILAVQREKTNVYEYDPTLNLLSSVISVRTRPNFAVNYLLHVSYGLVPEINLMMIIE